MSQKGDKVENLNLSFPLPAGPVDRTSIMFTLKNQVGCLARALQVFQELGINVLHLDLQNTDPNKVTLQFVDISWSFFGNTSELFV